MSYVKVGILGAAPGGEVWSINPTFDPSFEFPGTVDQAALDAAANAIALLSPGTQLRTYMSASLTITGARLEVRDDSTDELLAISIQPRVSPLVGTSGAVRASSSAMVFSLRTNTPGGSGRGRVYWPCLAGNLTAQLRLSASELTTALGEMATYLHAMEDALATAFPTIGFDLAVRSRTTHTTPHVNKIQVGDIPDVQRRRRDAMIEDYQSLSF